MKKSIKFLLSLAVAMTFVVSAYAQLTTSSLSGKVYDAKGQVLPGAAVTAVHTPSGTQYFAIVNAEGFYTIQGMRPGGPYAVEISLLGCKPSKINDVVLQLGETTELSATLVDDSQLLDEVVVSAEKTKFTTEKTGASTNVTTRDIENLPTVSRSISDLTKLSPYANGMSFAGSDGRSTNFTVDGANFNNNFGLKSILPGGGTPISVDALEEVQLVVAPYDVRQSNFVGGGINAITRSGTNTFKGTVYGYYSNQDMRGNTIDGVDLGERKSDINKTLGFTIGGPIIKNKLFFFANVEWLDHPGQTINVHAASAEEVAAGLAGTGNVSKTTAADMERVYARLKNDYKYEPGSYKDFPGGDSNVKILGRVDWNISDAHKLSVRYNKTTNTHWCPPNGNSCDDAFRNKGANRASLDAMCFANNMYSENNNVWSVAAELNSRFGDKISNQLQYTYTNIDDLRGSNSTYFPHIDIMQGKVDGKVTNKMLPAISAGYELFTYYNGVANTISTLQDNVTAYLGAHKVTAGLSWERQNAQNSYIRNGAGYYRFASIDDFLNGELPVSACLTVGSNGVEAPVAQVTFNKFSLYAQDEWNITKNFKFTYGVRGDMIVYDNSQLMTNNAIKDYVMGGRSVDTGLWPKATPQISPRVGFSWDVLGDKTLKVRGGAGLFQGRLPLVFFTNMPTNAAMLQVKYNYSAFDGNGNPDAAGAAAIAKLKKADGTMISSTKEMVKALGIDTTVRPEDGKFQSVINGVARDFKMPHVAKLSIAADYKVPVNFPLTVTAEGMFTKTIYGVMLEDWTVNKSTITKKFSGVDDRYNYTACGDFRYPAVGGNKATAAYVLSNTSKGYGWNAALTVKTQPVKNLDITAAYVHQVNKEITGMPGSDAGSAYTGLYTVNGAEFAVVQNSQYVVPDKLMANISYFVPWKVFGGNGLHLNLYYSAYSHGGYSYVVNGDMNGDGNKADLMYIYAKGSDINFIEKTYGDGTVMTALQQAQAYDKFLAQDKYMSKHKGQYAEAYSGRSPFVHRFDLRIAEDFAFKIGNTKHNFQLSASIENIGNMINDSWGVEKWSCNQSGTGVYEVAPLAYEGTNAAGQPQFSMNSLDSKKCVMPTETYNKYYTDPSQCFHILFGIKYLFN